MEIDRAIDALAPLICAYPAARITEETIQVYAVALSELHETEIAAGVLRCIRTCKFFPSIAEIMDASQSVVKAANGTTCKSPDEAWKEVVQQMKDAFVYRKPVFSTPEIEQAALSMGWNSLCETPVDQAGVARAQFLRLYESVCNHRRDKSINDSVIQTVGAKNLIEKLSEKK